MADPTHLVVVTGDGTRDRGYGAVLFTAAIRLPLTERTRAMTNGPDAADTEPSSTADPEPTGVAESSLQVKKAARAGKSRRARRNRLLQAGVLGAKRKRKRKKTKKIEKKKEKKTRRK
jgi:hypothetical protein